MKSIIPVTKAKGTPILKKRFSIWYLSKKRAPSMAAVLKAENHTMMMSADTISTQI